jgi:hypothetical protein
MVVVDIKRQVPYVLSFLYLEWYCIKLCKDLFEQCFAKKKFSNFFGVAPFDAFTCEVSAEAVR